MDLSRILPRELVNTHIVFKAPSGDLQSGVRFSHYGQNLAISFRELAVVFSAGSSLRSKGKSG
jgi:hypothetical protein